MCRDRSYLSDDVSCVLSGHFLLKLDDSVLRKTLIVLCHNSSCHDEADKMIDVSIFKIPCMLEICLWCLNYKFCFRLNAWPNSVK